MATIVPLLTNIIDGDFTHPVEIEGSPLITTDEITRAKIITRSYAVLNSYYVPQNQGIQDAFYKTALLVNEQPSSIEGPILFFQRVFAQVPSPRIETRTVSFTLPGKSLASFSLRSGGAIGWNPYGEAAPYSTPANATVTTYYAANALFAQPPKTRITYNGAPVDFVGTVYKNAGTREVFISPTESTTEENWILAGSTSPLVIPGLFTVDVNVSRWRGNIWQMEVVQVLTALI